MTLAQSSSRLYSNTDSSTNKFFAKAGVEQGWGVKEGVASGKFTFETGYSGEWTSSTRRDTSEASQKVYRELQLRHALFEGRSPRAISETNPFSSRLFAIARALSRMVDEAALPGEKRLREFGEASRASLEASLYSAAPIDLDLDRPQVADRRSRALHRRRHAAGRSDVVVLDEDRVIETQPVVHAAAESDGAFLERAEARCRLARAGDLRVRAFRFSDKLSGKGRNA